MVQKEKPARGRPRQYDPEEALANAMVLFWDQGYAATSLDDLSAATGMNRPSLYAAFGSKHDLYLRAFAHYMSSARDVMANPLDPKRSLREGLTRFYQGALSLYLPTGKDPRGCFMIGTAVTESVGDPEIRSALRQALRLIETALEARFALAQKNGEIGKDANPASRAKLAASALYSIAIQARAGEPRRVLTAIADAAVETLCAS